MALFDELKKKVVDATQTTVKATKDLAATTRLNAQVADEQRKIEGLYTQIGKLYFEQCDGAAEEPFAELCSAVNESNALIEKLKTEIQIVKGIKVCPNCGNEVPAASAFCGNCGTAVADLVVEEEAEVDETPKCIHCGAEIQEGDMFCGSCGQKQVQPETEEN